VADRLLLEPRFPSNSHPDDTRNLDREEEIKSVVQMAELEEERGIDCPSNISRGSSLISVMMALGFFT
jgi:hypothetical protein